MVDAEPASNPTSADREASDVVEHFPPTSGRLSGALLVLAGLAVALTVLINGDHPAVAAGGIFAAIAGWAVLLRPRVSAIGPDLVLRNPVVTHRIPLAAIEQLAVRQVLVLRAGPRKFSSVGLGRSRRSLVRDNPGGSADRVRGSVSAGEIAEGRIDELRERARIDAGVRIASDEQEKLAEGIRTQWAWPEILGLSLSLLACVVLAIVV